MKICAVILNYRGARMTESCLLSLIGQGLHRVLVIDNSANDDAHEELKQVINRILATDIDYSLCALRPSTNLGFARGVNLAFTSEATTDCDAFLLLNNDATVTTEAVSKLSQMLIEQHADLVAPIISSEDNKSDPVFWYQRFFGLLTPHRLVGAFPYLSGCCLLFRRDLLRDNKLFDEDFFMYGEDTFLGWQMAKSRRIVLQHPNVQIHHVGRGSSKKCRLFYEYHMARAHILLALKTWNNPFEIPFLIAAKSLVLTLRAVWRSLRFRTLIPMLAVLIAWLPLNIRAT